MEMQYSRFPVHDQLHVFMDGSCVVGCSDIRQTTQFDALRDLTVGHEWAAHVAVWQSSDIGIYN